jgi:hypothetical protein
VIAILVAASVCTAQNKKDCLSKVYGNLQTSPTEAEFDRSFDQVNGSKTSISCYLYIPASKARAAIEALRLGILYDDDAQLLRAVKFPLRVIVDREDSSHRNEAVVRTVKELRDLQHSHLTDAQRQVISCAWLGNVSLVGGNSFHPGFIIGDGIVFFSTSPGSGVKVTLVDLMPVSQEMLGRACSP